MRVHLLSSRMLAALLGTIGPGLVVVPCPRPVAAAEKGKVAVERVEYKGWKDNLRLSNGDAEVIVTLDVGPRIISYRLEGGKNVLKEFGDQLGRSGESEWMIRGGHRLWSAPEDTTRTYAPDNAPVRSEEVGPGHVRLTPPPEKEFGLQKEIDLVLEPQGSRVKLVHRIRNIGQAPTVLAPWALTVMAPGGVEIIPLPPKKPHPGSPKNARSADDFAANQLLRLWAYTDLQDPRWHFGSRYITLRQEDGRGPTKLGLAHQMGWVGYLNNGTLFVKRFEYRPDEQPYPDGGCNYETFTSDGMLELESLGPLTRLMPGKDVQHAESWELTPVEGRVTEETSIDRLILPRVMAE